MTEDYAETKNIDSLVRYGLANNDMELLEETLVNLYFHRRLHEYYYYLQLMANKTRSSSAYYYLYRSIADYYVYELVPDSSIYPMDSCTKSLALYFLSKAHQLGNEHATPILLERYLKDENIPPLEEFRKKVCW